MPTVQQLLDDINARLPNTFSDTQKIAWMNDCQNEVWRYMASTEMYEFQTVAAQALYALASDMRADKIKSLQVSNSTVRSTDEGYATYSYCASDDDFAGSNWYDGLGNLGLYPVPAETNYNVKVTYEASPTQLSTNTLGIVPSINVEYQDILKFRAMKVISQSGNAPDVELANNYQSEEDSIMARVRMDYHKRKTRNPVTSWSYRRGFWRG